MKFTLLSILFLIFSCSHQKTNKYSNQINFHEDGKKFEAEIKFPKSFKKRIPLIMIVHEWWGRNEYVEMRQKMLNDLGYATIAVDIYGDNKLVETPKEAEVLSTPFYKNPEIGIRRLNQYFEMAKNDPHIDPNNIFIIGYCFGGSQALNFARSGVDLKGVASFHGALHTTVKPTKNIRTKFLILNGKNDPMVSKTDLSEFRKEMKENKIQYSIFNYKEATHAFTNPASTEVGKKYNLPVAYNEAADKKSWNDFLSFLKENLK